MKSPSAPKNVLRFVKIVSPSSHISNHMKVVTIAIGDIVIDKVAKQYGVIEEMWGYEAQLIKIKWHSQHDATMSWTNQENVMIIRNVFQDAIYHKPVPFYPPKQVFSTPPRKSNRASLDKLSKRKRPVVLNLTRGTH